MGKIKAYTYKREGKIIKVPAHTRRYYKGYRHKGINPRKSYIRDHKIRAKYRPRKKYRKGLGNKGDW